MSDAAFSSTAGKIGSLDDALQWRRRLTGPVVFTNGVFDLLHRGHVEYLEAARALGAALVVALNDDDSARRLAKGPGRPFVTAADRARTVAALAAVDRVLLFAEDTPARVIETLRPDVLVKGADYDRSAVVGGDFVESLGGRVALIPLSPAQSTTSIVERIRGSR